MPADPRRIQAIFLAAIEATDPAARAALLARECGDDAELRWRVDALLQAHDQPGSFLDPSATQGATSDAAGQWMGPAKLPRLTEGPGTHIGPYKLLQQIGEGGMGVVYMAEQEEPVRRKVALKIIKPGMDSRQVIARFEAERQALAMMEHQNIARVLDAGTTESGRPYFVMELVHGVTITGFCDDNKLTPRERLELFVPVCQAIQHAHQKGIIHRDVKPSNVLVTMYDDKPVPKVIDFGVAKAIEQRLTEKTLFTQFGALVGTFEYMSPEQAEMNAFGVDTRSDVYSLGVLLYELLTGTTPLERQRLREAALDELVRLIRDVEPPRPSQRLSSSNNLPKIAAARKTEPARLANLVRGEIDWIVMRCLEKDRSRRYETASGLARDVERYLADEPVEACPPSARYRLSKFARKHKKALATAAAFVVLLVAGLVVSTLLAVWATSAEREANQQRLASDEAKGKALEAKEEADQQRDAARLTAFAAGLNLAQRAWEESDVIRARELLEEVPREAGGRDLRGLEWYYLSRLCHSEALSLEGTCGAAAFSPDGQRMAVGGSDNTIKVRDSVTGKELLSLKGHAANVGSLEFSPDGQRLASGGWDKMVKVWDSLTGKELLSLKGHADGVSHVAFSPDGNRLASVSVGATPQSQLVDAGSGITVKVWDGATGKELSSVESNADLVTCLDVSRDSQRLASGSADGKVQIWDATTGKELLSLKGHAAGVMSVAFSPDGQRLASLNKYGTLEVWDSVSGKELLSVEAPPNGAWNIVFSPDGQRLATGSKDGAVKVWSSRTGKELFALKGHAAGVVVVVAFSPDGQRLASHEFQTQTLKIWDCAIGKELFSLKCSDGSERHCVVFSPDGQRLASGGHRTVNVWDGTTGRELLSVTGHASRVSSLAFSPDGRRLASGGDSENEMSAAPMAVMIWDSATGKELLSLKDAAGVTSVAFSPDGQRLASSHADGMVKIRNSVTGKELVSLDGLPAGPPTSVAFSPDGQRLAAGGWEAGTVKIWNTVTGKELLSLPDDVGTRAAFSPDGQRLASWGKFTDNTVAIWDSVTGKKLLSLKGHLRRVTSVAFSPDGQRLASGSWDNMVKVWDSATGKELLSLKGHADRIHSVTFSPDGRRLAAAGDGGSISVWETTDISVELQERRAANQRVADLFRQLGLRADVLERLRSAPALSRTQQEEALAAAQASPEPPMTLNSLAWEQLKQPGRDISDYRKAQGYADEACLLVPNDGELLNTLGVAHYRVGNYDKALAVLLRSNQIRHNQDQVDLAFLAMTQQHLGHEREAQAHLQRLRERMKEDEGADAQGFLREAEALLAKPKRPDGK
jgi:WD40 repeat protein/serine/threonine protein kinase